ncbi:hypothetical protein B0H14DRAFT_2744201, partial [Mycena olivaceomarginata]
MLLFFFGVVSSGSSSRMLLSPERVLRRITRDWRLIYEDTGRPRVVREWCERARETTVETRSFFHFIRAAHGHCSQK